MKKEDFLTRILSEAKMKSIMLNRARERDRKDMLELPFLTKSYSKYFAEVNNNEPDFKEALSRWESWLEDT